MKYNTISSTQEFRKCIGGGAGQKGTIIIEKDRQNPADIPCPAGGGAKK